MLAPQIGSRDQGARFLGSVDSVEVALQQGIARL